jgi:hypothetical protein
MLHNVITLYFLKGDDFLVLLGYFIILLHLPPLTVDRVEGCCGRTQDCCEFGIGIRQSAAQTKDYMYNAQTLIHALSTRSHSLILHLYHSAFRII